MPGFWVQTYGARTFRLDRPDASDVDIVDIAHSLSVLPRFCGHTLWTSGLEWGYSVAQHSVLVARIADQICGMFPQQPEARGHDVRMLGLLHDAHEAYVGDVSSPMKDLLGETWHTVELAAEEAVRCAFGLPVRPASLPIIKQADLIARATEARDLLKCGPIGWGKDLPEPIREAIEPWRPSHAKSEFLGLFFKLSQDRDLAKARA